MKLRVTVNGVAYEVDVEILEEKSGMVHRSPMAPAPAPAPIRPVAPPAAAPAPTQAAGAKTLNSSIPGTVLEILVKPGQAVKAGEAVVVLDAMKMNTQLAANADGVVKDVLVSAGEAVKMGQPLISFE